MLQPNQLEDVSTRYPGEIAELRAFLASAGLTVGGGSSLAETAGRVREDRGFRRDLTSYVWVILDGQEQRMSYAQLLGVLAVAAAGTTFAAAAGESDAHELLRFVMEASRSFGGVASADGAEVKAPATGLATPVRARVMQPAVDAAVAESAGERFELSLDRRKVYGWAAAFLLLFVVLGMWWWHAAGVRRGSAAVSDARVVAPVAAPPVESVDSEAERRFPTGMTKKEGMTRERGVTKEGGRTEKSVKAVIQPAPPLPVRQPAVAAAVVRTAPAAEPKSPAKPTAAVAAPKPSNSEEEAMEDSPEGGGDFHLLRRPGDPKNVPTPVGPVKPGPVVRPTSLGVMAGHVIYSPTPEYPKAASDAHVQGEVKVEAEIDRTGNVISTRVISGPPLLRQAALDAIGRWQYRPYLDHGRDPIGVNTEILVDFELP